MASIDETYDALMKAIKESAENQRHHAALRDLAEAYAWLVAPDNAHGAAGGE